MAVDGKVDALRIELKADIGDHGRRITRLESDRR
jgi:hypothetical protein